MNYTDIMKRSWHITWRYKALWVLGVFAGVSGCQASGGGGNGGSGGGNSFQELGNDFSGFRFERFLDRLTDLIPLLVAIALMLILIGFVFAVLSIAARGGLVVGANAADEGRRATLTELWGAGFGRFWALLGLELLLGLPVFVVVMLMLAGIFVPLFTAMAGGGDPTPATFAPVCGSLGLGLPIVLVLSFVLGIMRLIGMRYLMLGRQGVIDSARNGWRFFRARFKDTFLLWLINAGLNIVAAFVLAIPMIIVGIGVAIPMVAALVSGEWALAAGTVALMVVAIWIIAMAYNAVWGTFTSALWTVFFRDVSGMSASSIVMAPAPAGLPFEPAPPATVHEAPATPVAGPPMAPPPAFPQEPPAPPMTPEPPADA